MFFLPPIDEHSHPLGEALAEFAAGGLHFFATRFSRRDCSVVKIPPKRCFSTDSYRDSFLLDTISKSFRIKEKVGLLLTLIESLIPNVEGFSINCQRSSVPTGNR